MVDLTSEELSWQGLDADSFARLDEEARNFVVKRALLYRNVRDQVMVAELLNVMASEVGDKKALVDVLEGKNRRGVEAVRIIVRDFKNSGMQSIKDYYLRFYYAKADQILFGLGVQKEQPKGEPKTQPQAGTPGQSPAPPVGVPERIKITIQPVDAQKKPEARASGDEYTISVPMSTVASRQSREERVMNVASEVSRWTNLPVGKVVRMDKDLIDRIIAFSDAHADRGVTDKDVLRACEHILHDKRLGVQFPLEVLTLHKEELLSRVLTAGKKQQ